MMTLRALFRQFVPYRLRAAARRIAARARRPGQTRTAVPDVIHFTGDYPDWNAAEAACAGWDQPAILERVRETGGKARDGLIAFERDGFAFDRHDHLWPLLTCLLRVAAGRGGRLHVLDFGGSLGSTYFQCRPMLAGLVQLRWSVVEQPHYVACGRAEFQNEALRFHTEPEDCLADGPPDVLLLSGVLQCLPHPHEMLARLLALGSRHVVLDRTPLLPGAGDRLTVQHVPPEIYGVPTRYPCWFFSRARLEAALGAAHELVAEFDALDEDAPLGGGLVGKYVGQHWRRTAAVGATNAPIRRSATADGRVKDKLRIGIVLPRLSEAVGGGYTYEQNLLGGLLERMPESRHEFVLLSVGESGSAPLPGNCRRIVLPAALAPEPLPSPRESERTQFLRGHGIDLLIHLNPFWLLASDVPYIAVVWDLQHRMQPHFPEVTEGGAWEARQKHFNAALPRASWVVTGTQAGKAQVEFLFGTPAERIAVVPMPTPADALAHRPTAAAETARRYGLREPYLFYPAQFWPHKNHVTLLHALQELGTKYGLRPQLVFTRSDQGNLAHVLGRAEELGVAGQVRHLGFLPRGDVLDLFTGAVLTFPSMFGPDNLPPLEAFAQGCPVIASRVDGAEEQLGDAARLVDPLDAAGWAEAIHTVLTDPAERQRLIDAGRARANGRTASDAAARVLELANDFARVRALWS